MELFMPKSTKPTVNSWLEDELYQQYLYDRRTVDPGWTHVFEPNGEPKNGGQNGQNAERNGYRQRLAINGYQRRPWDGGAALDRFEVEEHTQQAQYSTPN